MGIDISVYPERLMNGEYRLIPYLSVFRWRHYGMYAFFAGILNSSGIPPLSGLRRLPENSVLYKDFYNENGDRRIEADVTWFMVSELTAFDYDSTFIGTFYIVDEDHSGDFSYRCNPTAATRITFRRFLGRSFFSDLERLVASEADRIIILFY